MTCLVFQQGRVIHYHQHYKIIFGFKNVAAAQSWKPSCQCSVRWIFSKWQKHDTTSFIVLFMFTFTAAVLNCWLRVSGAALAFWEGNPRLRGHQRGKNWLNLESTNILIYCQIYIYFRFLKAKQFFLAFVTCGYLMTPLRLQLLGSAGCCNCGTPNTCGQKGSYRLPFGGQTMQH